MAMLRQDVAEAEGWLNAMFGGKLTQNQYDATVSLVYNIGIGNFRSSTLCTVMRANPLSVNVATEWRRWCRASGKIVPGLSRRRENEIALYFGR
jgi:lysozyme